MIRLQLIGHLGQDAVQRQVNGKTVLSFRVAHTRRYTNKDGVMQEKTIWVDCSYWEHEKVGPYLTKGTHVYIDGTPSVEVYVNNQGEQVATLRLQVSTLKLLSRPRSSSGREQDVEEVAADDTDVADDLPF
ncbi:single-stranded DNA-binding protein [Chitinophaga filiformis]|uniref:Single-stranded DNA-binding protein n=1 Tax=Chitinophaga filiformis TaxID=104663 RepID=A0A1G7VXZ4_CHIFI|nr:single-stranded DNA-binding protein [Chitinophaga filiformis]SDG64655.1 single-strand DNA-binding protein [Chitinophaga filiformis]